MINFHRIHRFSEISRCIFLFFFVWFQASLTPHCSTPPFPEIYFCVLATTLSNIFNLGRHDFFSTPAVFHNFQRDEFHNFEIYTDIIANNGSCLFLYCLKYIYMNKGPKVPNWSTSDTFPKMWSINRKYYWKAISEHELAILNQSQTITEVINN